MPFVQSVQLTEASSDEDIIGIDLIASLTADFSMGVFDVAKGQIKTGYSGIRKFRQVLNRSLGGFDPNWYIREGFVLLKAGYQTASDDQIQQSFRDQCRAIRHGRLLMQQAA